MQRNTLLASIGVLIAICLAAGCSSASGGADTQSAADSLRRADSLARADSLRLAHLRADSLRRDSLTRDSLFEANALRLSDFIASGSNRFLSETLILDNLRKKGFEVTSSDRHTDPNGQHSTDYRLHASADTLLTSVTLRYSEPYAPMTINFVDDRSRDIFTRSLDDAGFTRDETGNYVHPSNTSWAAAVITLSGRRAFLEWTATD